MKSEKQQRYVSSYKKILLFSSHSIRMNEKSLSSGNSNINKSNFYQKTKNHLRQMTQDVNKILVPKKELYGKNSSLEYFTGYNDDYDDIRP